MSLPMISIATTITNGTIATIPITLTISGIWANLPIIHIVDAVPKPTKKIQMMATIQSPARIVTLSIVQSSFWDSLWSTILSTTWSARSVWPEFESAATTV